MADPPRRREDGSGSPRPGKPRKKPAGAPKTGARASAQPRRPVSRPTTTKPLRSSRSAPDGAPRGKTPRTSAQRPKTTPRGRVEKPRRQASSTPRQASSTPRRASSTGRNSNGLLELLMSIRSDIERLNKSVDILTARVETLVGRNQRSGY